MCVWLQFATSAAPRRSHFEPSRDGAECDLGGAAEVATALSRMPALPKCDLGGAAEVANVLSRVAVLPSCDLGGAAEVANTLPVCLRYHIATSAVPRRS